MKIKQSYLNVRMAISMAMLLYVSCLALAEETPIAKADSAYSKGEYAEAVEAFTAIAARQGVSSQLYYNLGNSYAKGGDYGKALVNYLRALRLDPSNKQAKANAAYIESKVLDSNHAALKGKKLSVDPDSPSFFSNVRSMIARDHLSDTWAAWAVVSFILFIVCLALYIFTRNVLARKIGFFGGLVLLGFSVVALAFAFMAASYRTDEGVLTGAKVKLMSEASSSSKENPVALTRGTRMTVLDSVPVGEGRARWYKVRLNSDFVGWVESSDFETIDM